MSVQQVNVLTYLNSLRPALPISHRKDQDGAYLTLSNGEITRLLKQRAITINGDTHIGMHLKKLQSMCGNWFSTAKTRIG